MNPVILEALHEELIKIAYMTAAGPLYMGNMPQSMGTGMVSARQAQQMTQMPGVRSMRRGGIVPEGKTQAAVLHGPEAVIPLSKDKKSTQRRKQLLKKVKDKTASAKGGVELARKGFAVTKGFRPKPGDIILVRGRRVQHDNPLHQATENLFRFASPKLQGSYSHAGLYAGNGRIIDAVDDGVRELPLKKAVGSKDFIVLRPAATPQETKKAIDFARRQVGKDYSDVQMIGAGAALLSPRFLASKMGRDPSKAALAKKSAYQCGGLIGCAYQAAGLSLSGKGQPKATMMSPASLLASPKTRVVFGGIQGSEKLQAPIVGPSRKRIRSQLRRYFGKDKVGSAEQLEKVSEVEYRGTTFPGYGKPIPSNRKGKKKMVLVKRGDKVRVVHFGQKGYQDFTQHKDKKRRKNYLTRSAGIRNKSGQLTKDDPFSPNYWARRELW